MTDRRVTALGDGWWWYRLPASTPEGYDRQWRVARVRGGAVQPHGSTAWYTSSAKWLRGAEWVPALPPAGCGSSATAITAAGATSRRTRPTVGHDEEKVERVAGEIVDVFLDQSDSLAAYYRRHPDHRDELVAAITRIMVKAVR